ncbi:MAG: phosphonate C-P lyase system protein PhnL [Alphaproteobacteria bacterium]
MAGKRQGETMIAVERLAKTFVLHNRGGVRLQVLAGVDFCVRAGECVALDGPSGAGKSTLMRLLCANYRPTAGAVRVRHGGRMVDLAVADPLTLRAVRRETIGHVSQFLRAIPRVPAIDVVAAPLLDRGDSAAAARRRAATLLRRLHIPEALWDLPPATFSGGEQQRVNVARGFAAGWPVLLLDEPTASLDVANRDEVMALIVEARASGAAIVGIFHDETVRTTVADRLFPVGASGASGVAA